MFALGFVQMGPNQMCPANEKRKWGFGFLVAWWCEWGKLLQNGDLVAHLFELVAWGWNLLSKSRRGFLSYYRYCDNHYQIWIIVDYHICWSNMRFWHSKASSGCCFSVAAKAGQQIVRSLHHPLYHHSQASRIKLSKANLCICFWQSLYIYNHACQGPVTWQEFKYGKALMDWELWTMSSRNCLFILSRMSTFLRPLVAIRVFQNVNNSFALWHCKQSYRSCFSNRTT
jgi:hypothetical protein